jgi:hypothetical protein
MQIDQSGKMVETKKLLPKFIYLDDLTKADINRPVTFAFCIGECSGYEIFLRSLKTEGGDSFIRIDDKPGPGLDALLKFDKRVMDLLNQYKTIKYAFIHSLQSLVSKSELQTLCDLAHSWHDLTGCRFVFIAEA